MKLKLLPLSALLVALILAGCGAVSAVVVALDTLTVAADTAVPFAGAYGPWLGLVADLSTDAATEISSTDSATVQAQKILNEASSVVQKLPVVTNASTQTTQKIQEVTAALNDLITILQQILPKTSMMAHAAGVPPGKPMPLEPGDSSKLKKILGTAHAIQVKLAAQGANRS